MNCHPPSPFLSFFIPMGLWVIGANGRVDIITAKNRYILFDKCVGIGSEEPKWEYLLKCLVKVLKQIK